MIGFIRSSIFYYSDELISSGFRNVVYLGNSFWRVFAFEPWIYTLLHFVFTQPGSSLKWEYLSIKILHILYQSSFKLPSDKRSENWVKEENFFCNGPFWLNGLTQVTRLCWPRGIVWSTGFLPVRSSKSTTPKLYTSLFWVNCPVMAYLQTKFFMFQVILITKTH